MTDDIVARLRSLAECDARAGEPLGKCMREAADYIEELLRFKIFRSAADKVSLEVDQKLVNKLAVAINENERLRAALHEWDALIRHQYSGSQEAMSDMTYVAQHTAHLLYGDDPWPEPRRTALGEKTDD